MPSIALLLNPKLNINNNTENLTVISVLYLHDYGLNMENLHRKFQHYNQLQKHEEPNISN